MRRLLEHLSRDSADERLREMATGVLRGETTLAAAAGSATYGEAVRGPAAEFAAWYSSLTGSERAEHVAAVRAALGPEPER